MKMSVERDTDAADVDPMHVDGEEADQFCAPRPGEDRRVHHRIVEMLALHGGVIAEHDVAVVQTRAAVDLQAVAHRHADRIGNEGRHAAGALREQLRRRGR